MRFLEKNREPVFNKLHCNIVGTAAALLGSALIGGGSSLFGGLFGKSAAQKSAETQANAEKYAADLQDKQYQQTRADQMPWMQAGQFGLNQLITGLGDGGQFTQKYNNGADFKAPTEDEARATPGYQFTADQGNLGILRGQSASGGAFTGGTLKKLSQYNTGLADTYYTNRFNQAKSTFDTNFNAFNTNQSNLYNRFASLSGLGQQATAGVDAAGQHAAATEGAFIDSAGQSTAAGQFGGARSLINGFTGAGNTASGYLNLSALLNSGGNPLFKTPSFTGAGNPAGSGVDPALLYG